MKKGMPVCTVHFPNAQNLGDGMHTHDFEAGRQETRKEWKDREFGRQEGGNKAVWQ
jgi:hypothetical protein